MSEKTTLAVPKLPKTIKESSFIKWRGQFKSYADVKGFGSVLVKENADLPAKHPSVQESTATGDQAKKEKKAIQENDLGMATLKLACAESQRALKCANVASTDEYPVGLAFQFWKRLNEKFAPKKGFQGKNIQDKLRKLKWKKDSAPGEFFEDLAGIENLARELDETDAVRSRDFVSKVVRASPKEYRQVVSDTINQHGEDNVTVEQLEDACQEFYDRFHGTSSDEDESESGDEAALITEDKEDMKGKCYNCGERGHRANKCPHPKKKGGGSKKKMTGNCFLCGQKGHIAANCWENPKNASKRPNNWKSRLEIGAATEDKDSAKDEVVLCSFIKSEEKKEEGSIGNWTDVEVQDKELSLVAEVGDFPEKNELHLCHPNIWIADTGASVNVKSSVQHLINKKSPKGKCTIFDNGGVGRQPEVAGDFKFEQLDKDGQAVQKGTIKDVMASDKYAYNLLSVSRYTADGWTLEGDKDALTLKKGKAKFVFDIVIPTGKGRMYCTYLKSPGENEVGLANIVKKEEKLPTMSVKEAHEKFGHAGEETTRKMAKACGYRVVRGSLKPCEACAVGKAKQKAVTKSSEHVPSTINNERFFVDILRLKSPKDVDVAVTKPNWMIAVEERTQMKFSVFNATKAGYINDFCARLTRWSQDGKPVKFIRCDNAGENKEFEKIANGHKWKLNLSFEYTGRATPQRNHLAELGFAIILPRAKAMMHAANVPEDVRPVLCKECINCSTMLDWLVAITLDGITKTRIEHWCGSLPQFSKGLRVWGEAGVVKTKGKRDSKLSDRGTTCMLVGYNVNSGGDVYRMWNPTTSRVICTRDIIWLKKMFYTKSEVQDDELVLSDDEAGENELEDNLEDAGIDGAVLDADQNEFDPEPDGDNIIEEEYENINPDEIEAGEKESEEKEDSREQIGESSRGRKIFKNSRVFFEASALAQEMALSEQESLYFAALKTLANEDDADETKNARQVEYACVGAGIGGGFGNTAELKPMKFKQAMRTPDKEKWVAAVEDEHKNMVKYGVWKAVPPETLPSGMKLITSTWAMKKKASGVCRARVVARGFEQIDGMHYDGSSVASPVTNELSIRMMMCLALMCGWITRIVDVKGAFLRGEFEEGSEPVYMEVPEGFEKYYPPNWILKLQKTLYGLTEAAKAFWRELLKAFGSMDFERSRADPCLYFKWTKAGFLVVWLSWIDDCACFGFEKDVEESREEMKELFECDDVGEMDEYVGCKIEKGEGKIRFTQPVMIQSFVDEFQTGSARPTGTPGAPGGVLVPVTDENSAVEPKWQTKYRAGVGKLLHMMRWSRPDIYNAVRDLSRHAQKCSVAHIKAMQRVMKYCVESKEIGWTLKPERKWDGKDKSFQFVISGKSDSDYACCTTTRRSVTGYVVYFEGAVVATRSLMQKIVALSVTEAEKIAAVQCAQEMLMAFKIVRSMGLKVKLPMILEVDNQGAVDLANNWSAGGRTKHMHVRHLWLRELKEKGIIKVQWISGKRNPADMFTKNLPRADFERYRDEFVE